MLHVALGSILDGLEVEAMMLQEVGILTAHHGLWHVGRHLLQRHSVVLQLQVILLREPQNHQRGVVHGDKPEYYYSKNRGGKECHHDSYQCFS